MRIKYRYSPIRCTDVIIKLFYPLKKIIYYCFTLTKQMKQMNKKEHTRKNINHEILNVVYKLELKNGNEIEIPY